MTRLIPLTVLLGGCTGPDVEPAIFLRVPTEGAELFGTANVDVVFDVVDESNDPVEITFWVDELEPVTVTQDGCARGCVVTGRFPSDALDDGEHVLYAEVTDKFDNTTPIEMPVTFSIFDVPYVESIAVLDTQESALNGPDIEVEVHLLHDETAEWLGCAPLDEVQQDQVQYDGLGVPFILNESGDLVKFTDIGLEIVRVVVIESDGGNHCPIWPELTEDLESDVDDLYGISPPLDLSLLFSGEVAVSVPNTTGLVLDRGRPLGVVDP